MPARTHAACRASASIPPPYHRAHPRLARQGITAPCQPYPHPHPHPHPRPHPRPHPKHPHLAGHHGPWRVGRSDPFPQDVSRALHPTLTLPTPIALAAPFALPTPIALATLFTRPTPIALATPFALPTPIALATPYTLPTPYTSLSLSLTLTSWVNLPGAILFTVGYSALSNRMGGQARLYLLHSALTTLSPHSRDTLTTLSPVTHLPTHTTTHTTTHLLPTYRRCSTQC